MARVLFNWRVLRKCTRSDCHRRASWRGYLIYCGVRHGGLTDSCYFSTPRPGLTRQLTQQLTLFSGPCFRRSWHFAYLAQCRYDVARTPRYFLHTLPISWRICKNILKRKRSRNRFTLDSESEDIKIRRDSRMLGKTEMPSQAEKRMGGEDMNLDQA